VTLDHLDDHGYASTLVSAFGSLTPENELKMERTQPQHGHYDFAASDQLVGFAGAHGLAVRGHALIYGAQTPAWVSRLFVSRFVRQAMEDHITTVVGRYRDRIRVWDVVNEALDHHGHYRPNAFYNALGPEYVELAFAAARSADPTAKLYYNEFSADVASAKRDAVVKLVTRLAERKLIDGVGLQMHVTLETAPTRDELVETMRIYEQLGLEVEITEMDVAAKGDGLPTSLSHRLSEQATAYLEAALACAQVAACRRITVWGVTDRYSWLTADQMPLLFDPEYTAKPALAAITAAGR